MRAVVNQCSVSEYKTFFKHFQKSKDVWYLRITQYADKLLEGLKDVDYPDNVKQQQIHWIGKSKGAFVNFDVDGIDEKLEIYTTRPDNLHLSDLPEAYLHTG